jgi:hypothetical protein
MSIKNEYKEKEKIYKKKEKIRVCVKIKKSELPVL